MLTPLISNEEITLKHSEKSEGFVVLSTKKYVRKVDLMLDNPESYECREVS